MEATEFRSSPARRILIPLLLLAIPVASSAQEEDGQRRGFWERVRLGGTVNFYSGEGEIRSDSAHTIIFRNIQIDDSVIRFEPRVDNETGRLVINPVNPGDDLRYSVTNDFIRDPRKDFGAVQTNGLEETLWLDLHAAYDVKSWRHGTLFVQLDAGYYSGELGDIEVAVDLAEEAILNPIDQDLTADDPFANYQFVFTRAGTLEQVPVSLSGLWQFRPRSPFRPYVGLGFGYLNLKLDESAALADVNADLAGIEFKWAMRGELMAEGFLPAETITVETEPDVFWLAQGGLEYNINRNWSVMVSAEYINTSARVQMRALGFTEFGEGISRNEAIEDVEGIVSEANLIGTILSLPVDQAVAMVDDIAERSDNPAQNERSYYTSFPVEIGDPVEIEIPNPTDPNEPTRLSRQSKLFIHGGDVQLDSFSLGVGFRYRY
jgi:hypothetical protein